MLWLSGTASNNVNIVYICFGKIADFEVHSRVRLVNPSSLGAAALKIRQPIALSLQSSGYSGEQSPFL